MDIMLTMRTIFLISLYYIIFSFKAYPQNDTLHQVIPFKDGKLSYSGVVEVKNASAKDLYFNAKLWIEETLPHPETQVKIDIENSAIMFSATIPDKDKTYYKLELTLQFRDGKYKYELSNVYFENTRFNIIQPIEDVPAFYSVNNETAKTTALKINNTLIDFINRFKKKLNIADYTW